MNLSKLVADDVPLFLSLLNDIFPRQANPPKKVYQEVETAVLQELEKRGLVRTDEFLIKIMQLYEVRKCIAGTQAWQPCISTCFASRIMLNSFVKNVFHWCCRRLLSVTVSCWLAIPVLEKQRLPTPSQRL